MRTLPISSVPQAVRTSLSLSRMTAICGEQAWMLGLQVASQMACEDQRVLYLCGDNRFNPYIVAKLAKVQQKNQEEALERILVARAFTAFQLDELIHRLNPEQTSGVAIISGICTAFFDEDVVDNDAARLFYRSLWRLTELSRAGLILLLTQSEMPRRTGRSYFLTDLCRASNVVMRLKGEHTFTLEDHHHQIATPGAILNAEEDR